MQKKSDSGEKTIREGTIEVLKKSQSGFDDMKKLISDITALFDEGKDLEALTMIQGSLIPGISGLYGFCLDIVELHPDVIGDELIETLAQRFDRFDKLMGSLTAITESENYTEVADMLRFDMVDIINEISAVFPELIEKFSKSDKSELDLL